MFSNEIKSQLRDIFSKINKKIVVLYFSEGNAESVEVTKSMLEDMREINSFIQVENYSLNSKEAEKYEVTENGTMVVLNEDRENKGVYYYGPPAGYEINSLVHTLLDFGGAGEPIPESLIERIKKIDKEINIKVFIGLGCPHCPGAVINAHTLAKYNPKIKGIMVESSTYIEMSKKFNVSSVPRIIINDGEGDLLGNQPIELILETIENM